MTPNQVTNLLNEGYTTEMLEQNIRTLSTTCNGSIQVNPSGVLTSITLSPLSPTVTPNGTQQLTATCKDQNGNSLTCPTLTWTSSNTNAVTVNSTGLVTGGSGSATLNSGASSSNSGNLYYYQFSFPSQGYSHFPVLLFMYEILSVQAGAVYKYVNNAWVQLTLTSDYMDTLNTTDVYGVWTSSSSGFSVPYATKNTATITASNGTINGTATATLTEPSILSSITITGNTSVIAGSTIQLTATCKDQNNNVMTCPTLTWQSLSPTIATINSSGLVTGVSAGTTSIGVSSNGFGAWYGVIITAPTVAASIASCIFPSGTTATVGISINLPVKVDGGTVAELDTLTVTSGTSTIGTANISVAASTPGQSFNVPVIFPAAGSSVSYVVTLTKT
jgi:hypothetical protein